MTSARARSATITPSLSRGRLHGKQPAVTWRRAIEPDEPRSRPESRLGLRKRCARTDALPRRRLRVAEVVDKKQCELQKSEPVHSRRAAGATTIRGTPPAACGP